MLKKLLMNLSNWFDVYIEIEGIKVHKEFAKAARSVLLANQDKPEASRVATKQLLASYYDYYVVNEQAQRFIDWLKDENNVI